MTSTFQSASPPVAAGDWKIFTGKGKPHNGLADLPDPPPWRFAHSQASLVPPGAASGADDPGEGARAKAFILGDAMRNAVNAALYLRRPLLLTGKPGTGKSTLVAKVAHELRLGPVLRWPINSRSTVRSGIYEYDAVGRLQSGEKKPPVGSYLKLGPLGTALMATDWPRALLIDEIDKSDLDFANDLLNVIEEAEVDIPELRRLNEDSSEVEDYEGKKVTIAHGRLQNRQFPFVVMTSNGEREFPAPFLRRCVRLRIEPPTPAELEQIVYSHLEKHAGLLDKKEVTDLITKFAASQQEDDEVATDQLLNAVFLTVALKDVHRRSFDKGELATLREQLLQPLGGSST
ncbi:AAA family ATPase [Chromobacterium violaceum]|uniref:AAA family ATPase n=1 Tax=Chromobacterium violaceum TaxID=536 RepID=UPI0005D32313|nr:MoxR family ATPase [Chromobacterium violaceum]